MRNADIANNFIAARSTAFENGKKLKVTVLHTAKRRGQLIRTLANNNILFTQSSFFRSRKINEVIEAVEDSEDGIISYPENLNPAIADGLEEMDDYLRRQEKKQKLSGEIF